MTMPTPQEWLNREEGSQHESRLERLRWIASLMPDVDWMAFSGGPISKYLFEEARYSYVYGQFLASIMLRLAFIEMSLASALHAVGRNDLLRSGVRELSKEALSSGWLNQADYNAIQRVRSLRNSITHFRPPADGARVETRAVLGNTYDYAVIERDARMVMEVVFRLFTKLAPFG